MSTEDAVSKPVWSPPATIEEIYAATAGNQFAAINRPTAGAREEKDLPSGSAPVQLYSLGTPNGNKVHIFFEEEGLDYDAFTVNIGKGEQFTSGFVAVNPNSKIPACVDRDGPGGQPINLFESGSIVLYFAEKLRSQFLPTDPRLKAEVMNWVIWQQSGQGPMTGACFGHFFAYAPGDKVETRDYGVARYGMEVQRLCSVLDNHLAGRTFLVGEQYTIADMLCYPWYYQLQTGYKHSSGIAPKEFLNLAQYANVNAWADRIAARPAVQRALTVCSWSTPHPKPWLVPKAAEEEAK